VKILPGRFLSIAAALVVCSGAFPNDAAPLFQMRVVAE